MFQNKFEYKKEELLILSATEIFNYDNIHKLKEHISNLFKHRIDTHDSILISKSEKKLQFNIKSKLLMF